MIHRALDVGINFLDTADMYGFGKNEGLVGRALKGRRDEAILATKFATVRPIAALQTEYPLWTRDPEDEVLSTCEALGITFVAYSPLGRGFLAGAFKTPNDLAEDDWRRHTPRLPG